MDEDAVMQQVASGNTQAFRRIVMAHQAQIVRYATRMLGDSEAAQDAAQETFVRLWRMRTRYRAEQKLAALLLRIARHVCLDQLRTVSREIAWETERKANSDGLAQAVQERVIIAAVQDALRLLPEEQRTVFVLSHYEGLSYQEIADTYGWPVGTVATRKRLAVAALRRSLAAWIETDKES